MSRWLLVCALLLSAPAMAHPLAPALLQLQEAAAGQYEVLWRTSVSRSQRLDVMPLLPPECAALQTPQIETEGGDAVVARWRVQCDATGLAQRSISVQGLAQSGINVILHLRFRDGRVVQALLGPDQPRYTVPAPQAPPSVFPAYLRLGVEHLLGGLDHLLFVSGLWLLVHGWQRRLGTLTAFTLGHSLTLALASLGLIDVDQALAEWGIALSILLLGAQVVRQQRRPAAASTMTPPWRMAAGFGLLHGLGFAGALAAVGLPQDALVPALLAFNIGIELGQLLWMLALTLLMAGAYRISRRGGWTMPDAWRLLPGYGIGSMAAFWCWQRCMGLFT